jgi:hypothetical protein
MRCLRRFEADRVIRHENSPLWTGNRSQRVEEPATSRLPGFGVRYDCSPWPAWSLTAPLPSIPRSVREARTLRVISRRGWAEPISGVRLRHSHRRVDHRDSFAAEHLVEKPRHANRVPSRTACAATRRSETVHSREIGLSEWTSPVSPRNPPSNTPKRPTRRRAQSADHVTIGRLPRGSAPAKLLGTVGRDHGVRASTGLGFAPSAARS